MNTFKQLFTLTALSFFLLPLASLADHHHHGLEDLHKHELITIIKAQSTEIYWAKAWYRFQGVTAGVGMYALCSLIFRGRL